MIDTGEFDVEIQDLVNLIAPYLPDNWEKTCIVFEDYGHSSFCITSYCLVSGRNAPISFSEGDFDAIAELFFKIRKTCIAPWKKAKFEFTDEGKFNVNFKY